MLIERLTTYKKMAGYVDPEFSGAPKRRQRTASEEERRKVAFANHEAESRKIKQEKAVAAA